MSVTTSTASSTDVTSSDVHLAIYDLSHGMARSLSAQFLGQQHAIDIIPHTGIIVYGKEYYFGSMGIEASDPSQFRQSRNIFPIETQHLGRTSVPREDFEQWCRSLSLGPGESTYAGHNYDLLHRNCNNFSHHAATVGLQLSRGAPEWVLNVPQRFLSSPMGQMMRPMLENMQLSGPTGGGTGFGSNNSGSSNNNSGNSTMANNHMGAGAGAGASTGASASISHDAADHNPWANLPSKNDATSTTTNANTKSEGMAISRATKHSSSSSPTAPPSPPKKQKIDELIKTPTLDSYTKPLLSSETKMVPLCIQKIKSSAGIKAMEEMERQRIFATLDSLLEILSWDSKSSHDHHNDANGDDNGHAHVHAHLHSTIDLLVRLSQMPQAKASERTFILMLIRLLVLKVKNGDILIRSMEAIRKNFITSSNMTAKNTNTALKAMAWCVLSNAIGSFSSTESATAARGVVHWDEYIDAAIGELSGENRVEIRQSAAAFLYNLMLYVNNKLCSSNVGASATEAVLGDSQVSDLHVMILCGVLEGLVEETDSTVLTRKLLTVGKIVRNANTDGNGHGNGHGNGGQELPKDGNASGSGLGINDIAASLVVDLGYVDAIKKSQSLEISRSNEVITKLTGEIVAIVSQSYSA